MNHTKNRSELICSGKLNSSYSDSGVCRFTFVTNSVIGRLNSE